MLSAAQQQGRSTVECLAASRILQERRWGINNLEIPLSLLCQTDAFLSFAEHLILNAEQFHTIYNAIVEEYRQVNRIRNTRHPVPNLTSRAGAFELPFWYWVKGDVSRGRVFVKPAAEQIELFSENHRILTTSHKSLHTALKQLQTTGKLRTRALTTTLFARLFLADLFVHGIGGAKYDEITDAIIADFFAVQAPPFMVLTATKHLPLPRFEETEADILALKSKLRELEFNAERFLHTEQSQQFALKKRGLIAERNQQRERHLSKPERLLLRPQSRQRHVAFNEINRKLQHLVQPQVADFENRLELTQRRVKANKNSNEP